MAEVVTSKDRMGNGLETFFTVPLNWLHLKNLQKGAMDNGKPYEDGDAKCNRDLRVVLLSLLCWVAPYGVLDLDWLE